MEDPYATLGVSRSASVGEIKTAYRRHARELHPDVNPGNAAAEERFKAISAAFDVLSDPAKKRLFDEFGRDGLRPGFDPEQARAAARWRTRPSSGFGNGGFRVNIEDLFGADPFGGRRQPMPRRGGDIQTQVVVDLRDVVLGSEREIALQKPNGETKRLKVKVPAGTEDGSTLRLAGQGMPGPGGSGDLLLDISVRPHSFLRCSGRNLEMDLPVTVKEAMVGGSVEVPTFQGPIKLNIPSGSQSGDSLRVRGRGLAGEPPGDLYVVLSIQVPDVAREPGLAERAADDLEGLYPDDVRGELKL